MGTQQSSRKPDSHDFGDSPRLADEFDEVTGQIEMHNGELEAHTGAGRDAGMSPSKSGSGKRDSILGLGKSCEFKLADDVWVQGTIKDVEKTEDGKVSQTYTVDNFDSEEPIKVERGSVRSHNTMSDVFGKRQLTQRSATLTQDGFMKTLSYQIDQTRKGYGFTGFQYTLQRLKAHTKPVLICIILVVVWILLAHYEVFEYEDDGTLDDHGPHRRNMRRLLEGGHDPCAQRRFLTEVLDTHATADPDPTVDPNHHEEECTKMVPVPSDGYLVGAVISCSIVFLLMEYPGWVIMILAGTVLTLSDTITEESMWHAMGFPTVIACCSVTAVAKGLANTHILRIVMEKVLDFNQGDFFHLTMLFLITGLLSTLVDNFAVIGIYQYVYTVFGQKTHIDNKVLMISLSFMSMIGGSCTVLASGAMLVARSFLEEAPVKDFPHIKEDQQVLGMFEMSAAAFPVLFISAPILAWWAPYLFGNKGAPVEQGEAEHETSHLNEHGHEEHGFIMKYQIGKKCKISHLHKIEDASYLWKEVACKDGKHGIVHINKDTEIHEGDIVYILAPGNKIQDLQMHHFELMEMNPRRANKIHIDGHVIAEGIVDPESDFIGITYGQLSSHIRHWHMLGKYHPKKTYPDVDFLHETVKGGDIILLEGNHNALLTDHHGFIHIAEHDSGHHHDIYLFQLLVSAGCLLFIIICTVLEVLSLLETVILSLVVLNQTGCLTMEEMLHKFKWRVLLLVSGAYAIAHAFVDTMLAEYLTQQLMKITDTDTGMLIVMYVLSMLLGLAFPPKAEIGIMYPICLTLAQKMPNLELKKLVMVVLQGTAIQLLTPNNPENSLIADGYSFADFFICGLPVMIISGIIFIPVLQAA